MALLRASFVFALSVVALAGCGSSGEVTPSGGTTTSGGSGSTTTTDDLSGLHDGGAAAPCTRWWALLHPNGYTPNGPGVYLFDEPTQKWTHHVPLPPDAISPHGLAFDGRSLWVSTMSPTSTRARVYELDPDTGDIRSHIDAYASEGVTLEGDDLWICPSLYANLETSLLVRMTKSGQIVRKVPVPTVPVIQDCVFDGQWFYLLVNGAGDVVYRVDPADGSSTVAISSASTSDVVYAMGFDGEAITVIDGNSFIDRYDRKSGKLVTQKPWKGFGWTTAIAPAAGFAPEHPNVPDPPK